MLPLIELIRASHEPLDYTHDSADLAITGITCDSRKVTPGSLFAAFKGSRADGGDFIAMAVQAGAVALLCDRDTQVPPGLAPGVAMVRAANPRRALAHMAARWYGRQPRHMAAVTGTDGKTSTADFFRQFWHLEGKATASIGTLGILSGKGEELYPGTHTTPDAVHLHKLLAELSGQGVDYVALEASSHGLHQHRLDGVTLEAAAFTNLTRDHLDYHLTEDAYFAAKSRLFSAVLPEGQTAVLNEDDARFPELKRICQRRNHRVIGFGRRGLEMRVLELRPTPFGQSARLELFGGTALLEVPLVGAFQVMNILTALGLALGAGGDMDRLLAHVSQLRGVPGRLEQVARLPHGAAVFIDYAHTPMALANILNTLRPHTKGRLCVVFGCGGDRDPGKRPEMGRIAEMLADEVIVTDDNPRSENPASIRQAVLAAATHAKEVADRREAIYVAIKGLHAGDIAVIAGKGHEKQQIVGDTITPFDDAQVTRDIVKALAS